MCRAIMVPGDYRAPATPTPPPRRASAFNVKRLQFVPTLFWTDTGTLGRVVGSSTVQRVRWHVAAFQKGTQLSNAALPSRKVPARLPPPPGPADPPPGFDRSCKSADFLNTYYCYNR